MKKYFQMGGLLLCLGLCSGCGPKVADPTESAFTGDDSAAQMEAMEKVGREGADADPGAGPGPDPAADPAAPAQ